MFFLLVWVGNGAKSRSGPMQRRLFEGKDETRNHSRGEKGGTTKQTNKSLNVKTVTFPSKEISTFVQFPSRKQLLSQVAKAINASKKRRLQGMKKKTNQNIWNSFWKNEKSGRLRSDPKELTLYDDELDGDSEVNRIFGARFGEMQSNEG